MSVKTIRGTSLDDEKKYYSDILREFADKIDSSQLPPSAVFIQIFHQSGEIDRARNIADGFDLLRAVGIFECLKDQLLDDIKG